MTKIPDLMTMLKSGVHFGHQLSKRHPKMKPYIFTAKSGFHILNLEQTQEKLGEALVFINKIVANGGTILFLGTKKQAQSIVMKHAKETGMPYVTTRWLGGTFTNFGEISKLVKKYSALKKEQSSGGLEKYTKKEKLEIEREITKLDSLVGGIEGITKVPDAIFVIDVKKEKTAVAEAAVRNIPIIAMCDTNVNPDDVNYIIPANDDAVRSIELVTSIIAEEIKAASKQKAVKDDAVKATAEKK